jgi:hypothetical protein
VGQIDLFGLIQNDCEKAEGKGDHKSDPTFWKKRDRFKNPDERILNFPGTGDSRKEDCITENKTQAPACEDSQTKPILANGKPRESRNSGPWCEESLKKEESKKKDRPNPKVTEKLSER